MSAPYANTPFGTKGVDAKHRGDATIDSKSHPPRSPFLRKGEGKPILAFPVPSSRSPVPEMQS